VLSAVKCECLGARRFASTLLEGAGLSRALHHISAPRVVDRLQLRG